MTWVMTLRWFYKKTNWNISRISNKPDVGEW
jgi:hypothetical protein